VIYSPGAQRQIIDLQRHNSARRRPDALRNLDAALLEAERRIERNPTTAGLPAPRQYPDLARPGRRWFKAGPYWIAYRTTGPPVILAVFYETANIPGRL
jgi:plasmid stabilization system protein ParE